MLSLRIKAFCVFLSFVERLFSTNNKTTLLLNIIVGASGGVPV